MAGRPPSANQLQSFKDSQTKEEKVTTGGGAPIDDKLNSLTIGPRGPILLQDAVFLDELAHFDRERIPERVVHAKGAGAFGYFEVTDDITDICKAAVFSQVGKRTPIAVRFSTVGGESGSADSARDPRGFAVKFYTEEGNWDLVGNNTPIFFIRDPLLFPSFIHTQKRNPVTHLKDPDMFWDFITLRPETTHQITMLFSDRGTPNGHRHMNGYGSHTFKMVNGKGKSVYCKFHYKTDQGVKNFNREEADEMSKKDPDFAIRDLYDSIASKNYPSYTLSIQTMTMKQADEWKFNPFDLTKVWPHDEFPLKRVGKLVLNRNPANYFAEVEQLAFNPANMVPGIEPSPDKMLQGRLFSYHDTHIHRLGINYQQIPVNVPYRTAVKNFQRDGPSCVGDNQGGAPNYYPNSFSGPKDDLKFKNATVEASGTIARHESANDDNFMQAGVLFRRVLDDGGRERLVDNIASHITAAQEFIQERAIVNFGKVDPLFGQMLRKRIAFYRMKK